MTSEQAPTAGIEAAAEWLLVKRDLYYRPNAAGYTGIRDEAGRYTEAEAKLYARDEVTMIRLAAAPEFTCSPTIARDHLLRQREALTAENARLTERAEAAERERDNVLAEYENIPANELNATVRRLVEDRDSHQRVAIAAQSSLTAAQQTIERLTEALRPFAAEADNWADSVPDDYRSLCFEPNDTWANPGSETAFNVGDLRRARAVLSGEETK